MTTLSEFNVTCVLGTPPATVLEKQIDFAALAGAAHGVRERAYVPLSGFQVGAALLTESREVFVGVNVEASNGHSICAERSAVVAAVSAGHQAFIAVAAVADTRAPITPCGQCRQLLRDFGSDIVVIMCTTRGPQVEVCTIEQLLPRGNFKTAT